MPLLASIIRSIGKANLPKLQMRAGRQDVQLAKGEVVFGEPCVPLEAVEARRLYRQIADQLRALIDSGEYAVGSRLPTERDLAEQLKVSRPTVREALIALEVEGRVRIRVGSGIYVAEPAALASLISTSAVIEGPFELLRAREFIEGAIAEQAARVATSCRYRTHRRVAGRDGDGAASGEPRWFMTAHSMSRSPDAWTTPCWFASSANCSTSASILLRKTGALFRESGLLERALAEHR